MSILFERSHGSKNRVVFWLILLGDGLFQFVWRNPRMGVPIGIGNQLRVFAARNGRTLADPAIGLFCGATFIGLIFIRDIKPVIVSGIISGIFREASRWGNRRNLVVVSNSSEISENPVIPPRIDSSSPARKFVPSRFLRFDVAMNVASHGLYHTHHAASCQLSPCAV